MRLCKGRVNSNFRNWIPTFWIRAFQSSKIPVRLFEQICDISVKNHFKYAQVIPQVRALISPEGGTHMDSSSDPKSRDLK